MTNLHALYKFNIVLCVHHIVYISNSQFFKVAIPLRNKIFFKDPQQIKNKNGMVLDKGIINYKISI